jgi:flavin-dependent dehydrogenase
VSGVFDLIVVGGGVVGASAAYRSASRGARTLLVDARHQGRATVLEIRVGMRRASTSLPSAQV